MQLSQRLKAVADTVTKGNRVADVGCDHAYISIYLIETNIAPAVIAMDVNKGPLNRAQENIARYGLTDRITTRLSDGLKKLQPGEADTILIAGLGGALTIKILDEGREVVKCVKELVLQPQSELHLVRKYLHEAQFDILDEKMLKEEGKYYTLMKAVPSTCRPEPCREVFYRYGKILLEKKEPVVKEYLDREKRIRAQVMEELRCNSGSKAMERMEEVKKELGYIEEALSYYVTIQPYGFIATKR